MPSRVSRGVAVPEFHARLPFAIAMLLALGGCSSLDVSTINLGNLNPFTGEDAVRQASFDYFYKKDTVSVGPVTASDLIGPDGRCAFEAAPTMSGAPIPQPAAEAPPPAGSPINPRSNQALYFTAGPESGRVASAPPGALPPEVRGGPRGISLAMTECQVVGIAGYTDRVEVSANERGERIVTLTYLSGHRPGIYRFRSGRLVSMERVAEPPQAKKPQTKTAKSKQAR
jgi:hypothetical protein